MLATEAVKIVEQSSEVVLTVKVMALQPVASVAIELAEPNAALAVFL